jgi:hypothetical protein
MKFAKLSVIAAVAALVLSAWGNVASAQMTGWATGRWRAVDSTTKIAKGTMLDLLNVPLYNVDMRLHGSAVSGNVVGSVSNLPRPNVRMFSLFGGYAVGADGRTYVSAQFVLPVGPMFILLGVFDAVLDPTPQVQSIALPWAPATSGHFHGRWWHN